MEHPCRQNRQQGIPCERKFPGQEFIQHDPEGIDICPRIDRFSSHLFWRDVHRSPIETTRITLGRCRLLQRTRNPKIRNHHPPVFGDQQVVWLEITVDQLPVETLLPVFPRRRGWWKRRRNREAGVT